MRYLFAVLAVLSAGSAQADVGHLAGAAGHDHLLGAAALGAAIAIGLWAGLRGRKDSDSADQMDEADTTDEELQEA